MFRHIYFTRIRFYLRTREFMFWMLIFPMILTSLFKIAFQNIMSGEEFEVIPIAVVEEADGNYPYKDIFVQVIEILSKEGDGQIFSLVEEKGKEEAEKLLLDDKIAAYIVIGDEAELIIHENGMSQSIAKEVMDIVLKKIRLSEQIYQMTGSMPVSEMGTETGNYIREKQIGENKPETTYIYYFAALAMTCLMGGMIGIYEIINLQANLSGVGMRNALSPASKWVQFAAGLVSSCTTVFVVSTIVLLYIRYALGIRFGDRTAYVVLTTFVGSVASIGLGMLISALIKKGESVKIGIMTMVTITSSFFAGLMISDIKYLIQENVPVLAKINPATLIADGYYKLYYYENLNGFWVNIATLCVMAALCFGGTVFVLRRQKYDSV